MKREEAIEIVLDLTEEQKLMLYQLLLDLQQSPSPSESETEKEL